MDDNEPAKDKHPPKTEDSLTQINGVDTISLSVTSDIPSSFTITIELNEDADYDSTVALIEKTISATNFKLETVEEDDVKLSYHKPVSPRKNDTHASENRMFQLGADMDDGGVVRFEQPAQSSMKPPEVRSSTVDTDDVQIVTGNTPSSLKNGSKKCVTTDIAKYVELRYRSLHELVDELKSCNTEQDVEETELGKLYKYATDQCGQFNIASAVIGTKNTPEDTPTVNGVYYIDSVETNPVADLCINIPTDPDMTVEEFNELLVIALEQHRREIISLIEGLQAVVDC